MEAKIFI